MEQQQLLLIPVLILAAMAVYYWFAADRVVDYSISAYQSFPKPMKVVARIASFGLYERREAYIKLVRVTGAVLMLLAVCILLSFLYSLWHGSR